MNSQTSGGLRVWAIALMTAALLTSFPLAATAAKGDRGGGSGIGKGWGRLPGFSGGKNKCELTAVAPVIDGLPAFSVIEGMAYGFEPTASDANCDPLTFRISGKPSWAAFDASTGALGGIPPKGSSGSYPNVLISVSDGTYTSSLPAFTIEVYANSAPLIYGTPPRQVTSGTTYDFRPEASDPDGQTLRFAVTNRPAWASFDAATGKLSGTPAREDAGTYAGVVVSVSDGLETAALPSFDITVESTNGAPSISGSPATSVAEGQAYSFTPSASDPDGDRLSFSIQNRPSWASFDTATGRVAGTPSSTAAGSYPNIVITASDGTLSSSLPAFGIVVQDVNRAPSISGTPSGSVVVGQSYAFTPSASDPDGDPLSFSIVNKPSWVTFSSSTGKLSGSPASSSVGLYVDITVAVSDGKAQSQLGPFSISVDEIVSGTATLSWQPPTQRTDGSVLDNLAGYRILWGASQGNYPNRITLNNPGLTSYVVENLGQGTWYFVMTAFDGAGAESDFSSVGSKTVQ